MITGSFTEVNRVIMDKQDMKGISRFPRVNECPFRMSFPDFLDAELNPKNLASSDSETMRQKMKMKIGKKIEKSKKIKKLKENRKKIGKKLKNR